MATQGMVTGVSAIYKRLLNHRPVIQNEVQFFVKEFEEARGDSDHQLLKASLDMTNKVEVLMQEIATLSSYLKQITERVQESNSLCDAIFSTPERELRLPAEVQQALDADVAAHQSRVQAERASIDAQTQERLRQLKGDITRVREARVQLQARGSATPTTSRRTGSNAVVVETPTPSVAGNIAPADGNSSIHQDPSTCAPLETSASTQGDPIGAGVGTVVSTTPTPRDDVPPSGSVQEPAASSADGGGDTTTTPRLCVS